MFVTNVAASVDLDAIERECDSLRAEMGYCRRLVEDAKYRMKRKPCPKNAKRLSEALDNLEAAVNTYKERAEYLFANAK